MWILSCCCCCCRFVPTHSICCNTPSPTYTHKWSKWKKSWTKNIPFILVEWYTSFLHMMLMMIEWLFIHPYHQHKYMFIWFWFLSISIYLSAYKRRFYLVFIHHHQCDVYRIYGGYTRLTIYNWAFILFFFLDQWND